MAKTADSFTMALAQMNPTMGALADNCDLMVRFVEQAASRGADLVVFPELSLSAYPPQDLVRQAGFLEACESMAEQLARKTKDGPALLFGLPWRGKGGEILNAILLAEAGKIADKRFKTELPNYGVFDEKRNFEPGPTLTPMIWRGVQLGVMICEDMWLPPAAQALYDQGAEIFIVPHGSPYRETAEDERLAAARARLQTAPLPLVFVNQLGGQDELVFDGGAFVLDKRGECVARAPRFEEGLFLTKWQRDDGGWQCVSGPQARGYDRPEKFYRACVMGLRDYVRKNGFSSVVLGLSGGIDSSLVAAMAVDALGPDNVACVMLPSRFTSAQSLQDAEAVAKRLGVCLQTIPINQAVEALSAMLGDVFSGLAEDVTEENMQSRLRGVVLMALSNKFGHLLLSTGNKSEMAVGYATLYGDMNGAYNPLKDIYKTMVFTLCRWRNENRVAGFLGPDGMVIPPSVLDKPPSAELRENQTDQDSLPSYEVLDDILYGLIEEEICVDAIAARGHDRALVEKVQNMLYRAEYKRQQAPPGPKVSIRNFGRDRRLPLTNHWRDRDG